MDAKVIEQHHLKCEEVKQGIEQGPWTDEPNRVNWKHAGLDCMIVRNPHGLHLCGYVGVKPGHPAHEKFYDDVEADVHGGLTYAEHCQGAVCHVADDPADRTWWFGFDCAHVGDISPSHEANYKRLGLPNFPEHKSYKTVEYVRAETNRLAEQLSKVIGNG